MGAEGGPEGTHNFKYSIVSKLLALFLGSTPAFGTHVIVRVSCHLRWRDSLVGMVYEIYQREISCTEFIPAQQNLLNMKQGG